MRRKMMRSIVLCTEKFTFRWPSLGFLAAMLVARSCRHFSISARNAASTSVVPLFAFEDMAKRSKEPWSTASFENREAISSHFDGYSSKLQYEMRPAEVL